MDAIEQTLLNDADLNHSIFFVAMATAADLHDEIAAAKQKLGEKKAQTLLLREDSNRAEERQRLRRLLGVVQKNISKQEPKHLQHFIGTSKKK